MGAQAEVDAGGVAMADGQRVVLAVAGRLLGGGGGRPNGGTGGAGRRGAGRGGAVFVLAARHGSLDNRGGWDGTREAGGGASWRKDGHSSERGACKRSHQ